MTAIRLDFGTAGRCDLCSESSSEGKYGGDIEAMWEVACWECRTVLERARGELGAEAVRLVESQLGDALGDRMVEIRF